MQIIYWPFILNKTALKMNTKTLLPLICLWKNIPQIGFLGFHEKCVSDLNESRRVFFFDCSAPSNSTTYRKRHSVSLCIIRTRLRLHHFTLVQVGVSEMILWSFSKTTNSQSTAVFGDWFHPQTGQRIDVVCGELQREMKSSTSYILLPSFSLELKNADT